MQALAETLEKTFPMLSSITVVLLIIYIVVALYGDSNALIEMLGKIRNIGNIVKKKYYTCKREKYDKALISPNYIRWQLDAMKTIYLPLIEEKRAKGIDINLTSLQIGNKYMEYEAVTLQCSPKVPYPFDGICPKDKMKTRKDTSVTRYGAEIQKLPIAKQYYRMVKYTIRHPKRIGYMLKKISIGRNKFSVSAYVGCYENNVKESHVLEYELYKLYNRKYKKQWGKNGATPTMNRDTLLKEMPIRGMLHKRFGKESDILLSGKYRSSMLGVQMFVLIKNYNHSYDALRIRRSTQVAAKAGYLQFIPSGGFEAMNDGTDFDTQWDNYSISKVLFRELLEECFGIDEDNGSFSSNSASPDRIYFNPYIEKLLCMLNKKKGKRLARLEFMGTSMNLVGLRQELSFILRIDDASFASYLLGNYESRSAVHLVDIRELERGDFWVRDMENDDLKILNCTSAGLFELARKSELYQEALCFSQGN